MAVRSLWIHPLRAALATLGVVIGVAAIVAAMAILKGMSARFESGFASMGSNRVYVTPALQRRNQRVVGSFNSLKFEDATAIGRECPAIRVSMPQVSYPNALIKFLSKSTNANVVGATGVYCKVNDHYVEEGDFIKASDIQGSRYVAVLGSKVRRELFGGRPAIDEKIKITGLLGARTFIVIGVMEEKGSVAFQNVDEQIIIPVTTAMDKLFGSRSIHAVVAEAVSPADRDITAAKDQIKKLLRGRHKIRAGQQDDFEVRAQKELVEQVATFQAIVGVVLWSIAGISLVVGGIGIMNIMLVAVTERTREIGVRMAMGAQRGDVLMQFLVEAGVVSCLGGALGVLMGWGMATIIERITRVMETVTTGWAIAMALGMATFVGIVSGLYPAWKASRLDPVEALRYE
jgi:putative ABC transport system permease protein